MNTKDIVMSRVHAIHFMRPLVSTTALCMVLVLVSLYAITQEVWVAHVIANMQNMTDVAALAKFFAVAFLKTKFIVQVLSVVAVASAIWLARETAQSLRVLSPVRA